MTGDKYLSRKTLGTELADGNSVFPELNCHPFSAFCWVGMRRNPSKSNIGSSRSVAGSVFVASALIFFGFSLALSSAATKTWNSSSSSLWLTDANWSASGVPGSGDTALFNGALNPLGGIIDIQLKNGEVTTVGAISLTLASASITIGNSETKGNDSPKFLQLNGQTINSEANTILANATTSATTLTIQNLVGVGNKNLNLRLGNTTNVIQATANNSIAISSNIAELNAGSGITFQGGGTLTLSGTNTFSGATNIVAGTLVASAANALQSTSSVTVNNGGTLLLAGSGSINRVNNAAGLTLAGGTASMAGLSGASETMASLTLTSNSTLDFGTGSSNSFSFTSGIFGLATNTLAIRGWTGPIGSVSQDFLTYGGSGLSSTELANISFYDDSNVFLGTGQQISFGSPAFQVYPVPEPTTIFGALALVGLVGYRERRRLVGLVRARVGR